MICICFETKILKRMYTNNDLKYIFSNYVARPIVQLMVVRYKGCKAMDICRLKRPCGANVDLLLLQQ